MLSSKVYLIIQLESNYPDKHGENNFCNLSTNRHSISLSGEFLFINSMNQCHVYCSIHGWLLSSSCTIFEFVDGFVQLFVYWQAVTFKISFLAIHFKFD